MASSWPYTFTTVYQRQIRLLGLTPSLYNSEASSWSLFTVELERPPKYDALSYEWGDPDGPKKNILINWRNFPVGMNLWHALNCLKSKQRGSGTRLVLWVDAICINQSDTLEKNEQVAMMGDIYMNAAAVRVWLGGRSGRCGRGTAAQEENCQAKMAFALLKKIWKSTLAGTHELCHEDRNEIKENSSSANLNLDAREKRIAWFTTISTSGSEWEALACILLRRYWTRMWIVQEYILGAETTINLGSHSIEGSVFDGALAVVADFNAQKPPLSPNSFGSLETIINTPGARLSARRRQGRNQTLAQLLEVCKSSQCTLLHDRIYALLPIAIDVPRGSIPVDYTKSIWRVKVDVGRCFTAGQRYFPRSTQARVCSLLDEIFPNCEEQNNEQGIQS